MKISKAQERKFHEFYLYIRELYKKGELEYDNNLYVGTLADSDDVIIFRGDLLPVSGDILKWNLKHWVNGEPEPAILTAKTVLSGPK